MIAKWIVFYDNGDSYSSLDGPPWEAPRDYVQCIAVPDVGCGNRVIAEQNYYCWHYEDDEWVPHDLNGLVQYLRRPGDRKLVLVGYWANRERYLKIRKRAQKDDRLPSVTSKSPRQPEGE